MLGPRLLVRVPAALCERWAQGVRLKSGHLRWATNPRTFGPSDGRLCQVFLWYFLTRLVPSSRSHSSTRCRRGWYVVLRGSTLSSPFFSERAEQDAGDCSAAVVVDGKGGVEESQFLFSVARLCLVTTCRTHWTGVWCSSLLPSPHGGGGER